MDKLRKEFHVCAKTGSADACRYVNMASKIAKVCISERRNEMKLFVLNAVMGG